MRKNKIKMIVINNYFMFLNSLYISVLLQIFLLSFKILFLYKIGVLI